MDKPLIKKKFIKNKEDFICRNCKREVEGNGYTNHCPDCLWSKHVDLNPGDRMSDCGGMMRPISSDIKKGSFYIIQKCEKCGHEKRNKLADNDNVDVLINLKRD